MQTMQLYLHIDCKDFGNKIKSLALKRDVRGMAALSASTRKAFDRLAEEFPKEVVLWGGDEIILLAEKEILEKVISKFLEITDDNISNFHIRFAEDIADLYK